MPRPIPDAEYIFQTFEIAFCPFFLMPRSLGDITVEDLGPIFLLCWGKQRHIFIKRQGAMQGGKCT